MLRELKGRFVLSINDAPEIRELFAWAEIVEVETRYSIGGANAVRELLISAGVSATYSGQQRQLL